MVKKSFHLIAITLALIFAVMAIITVNAQERLYHIDHEWVKIWISQDGTIDLFYDMSLALDSGREINYVFIGQPQRDFTIGEAVDQHGHSLTTSDASSGSDYRVQVNLFEPLQAGQTARFNLTTNVASMLWEDMQNEGNVGMQFTPTWWEQANVKDLRILVILPEGVSSEMVKTTEVLWNNTLVEDGRVGVYWEAQNLSPDERYPVGVSFPADYVQNYNTQPTGIIAFFQDYGLILVASVFGAIIMVAVVYTARKKAYLSPQVSMETLGIKRGLTAVEASYLLDMKPTQIVTEILYSLLKKRAVWVQAASPVLKLRVMPLFENKTGTNEKPLRYYEIDFLHALKDDGSLDEGKLAHTVIFLRDTVEQKLQGYSRRDTEDYYRKIVTKAWMQVEQAGTVDLTSKAYDEQLLWLMLDPNYRSRTETTFRNRTFDPSPLWFWYWYGYRHYNPHPTYKPNIDAPAEAPKPPTIPGAEFANNIATAVEKTSSNIVTDIEKFANAIIPMQPQKASHAPARRESGCVCACAACACACACVSCACACAGGGVG
ncbi:hypothetical protein AC478_01145 [miscellaneous Crenarchaeota group-1 archaeon SG8-32-3]|uniref:DUF2207 domain-containing protein n=1 Tax=miscellaneous Crenarchaeota group-1 archaeon SG8-32-3 TaxID=1685125 RepID=A0A0M0BVH0_9ARCH|nr:MAG: hypothetical protein AC478_01145 [miscellaneous Crenarchaeota group-1 archaeon SG8-32-3]